MGSWKICWKTYKRRIFQGDWQYTDRAAGMAREESYAVQRRYIMRMIKEMARVLFSLMLGKQYVQVELLEENKYEVSGKKVDEYKEMIDL